MNKELILRVVDDALSTIEQTTFMRGTYISGFVRNLDLTKDLQCQIGQTRKECAVCLLGDLFLSLVELENNCPADSIFINYGDINIFSWNSLTENIFQKLEPVFGPEQLGLLEAAFECRYKSISSKYICWVLDNLPNAEEKLDEAVNFGKRCISRRERVRAILLNVKANNGVFIP